ncbi:unnamed protein product [Ostreobium quekettii]|uniref:Gamma-tubulin complex component n=1 Tax=Ostreobium quekettii TaxID=121088 RepID=A0A8S1IN55_9CHLO|nr:unnamed protein product [Ostreobium quekettii]|eukprot:evm.model.scf_291.8 EVM.evm.TU.scf_291.8   scf_291:66869-71826(-)
MATSKYGAEIERQRSQLLQQLVEHLFKDCPEGTKTAGALRASKRKLQNHRFLDTDPTDVEGLYKSLEERLILEAQEDKQQALSILTDQLLSLPWVCTEPEIHCGVLRLLFYLCRRPTRTPLPDGMLARLQSEQLCFYQLAEPGCMPEELEEPDQSGILTYVDDVDNCLDICSSPSVLSDWSEEDLQMPAGRDGLGASVAGESDIEGMSPTTREGSMAEGQHTMEWGVFAGIGQQAPSAFQHLDLIPPVLQLDMAKPSLQDGAPVQLPTTKFILQQCVRALQGVSGPVFCWRADHQHLAVDATCIHSTDVSISCLQGFLQSFAQTGTKVRLMLEHSTKTCSHQGSAVTSGGSSRCNASNAPTFAAFADALEKQVIAAVKPVVKLEQQLDVLQHDLPSSLVLLKTILKGVDHKVSLLHQCAAAVFGYVTSPSPEPVDVGCHVLDTLYDMLEDYDTAGGPAGTSDQQLLWHLMAGTLQPLLENLTDWLWRGETTDMSQEFFICTDKKGSVNNADFWLNGFPLREGSSGPGVPTFLFPIAEDIQAAGKALHVLQSNESFEVASGEVYWNALRGGNIRKGSAKGLPDRLGASQASEHLLYQSFLKKLGNLMAAADDVPDCPSPVYGCMAVAGFYAGHNILPEWHGLILPWLLQSEAGGCDEHHLEEHKVEAASVDMPDAAGDSRGATWQDNFPADDSPEGMDMEPQSGPDGECETHANLTPEDQSVEGGDSEGLPKEYTTVLEGMQEVEAEFERVDDARYHSRHAALVHVLPRPTCLAPFLGDAVHGEHHLGLKEYHEMGRKKDMLPSAMLPAQLVMQETILHQIKQRCEDITGELLYCLLEELGMKREFMILSNMYLLMSPAIISWSSKLCSQLIEGTNVSELRQVEVEMELHECLSSAVGGVLPSITAVDVNLEVVRSHSDSRRSGARSVTELQMVSINYRVAWPLCMFVDELRISRYNMAFVFLLQLQWVCASLEAAWQETRLLHRRCMMAGVELTVGSGASVQQIDSLLLEMSHFSRSLQEYVLNQCNVACADMEKELEEAGTVESVQQAHDNMLERVLRVCLLERYKVWRVVRKSVLGLMDQVLNACVLIRSVSSWCDGRAKQDHWQKLERVAHDFRESHSFLLRLLTSYSMALGGSVELEHLIMRLNFNEYYSASLTPLQEFEKMLQDFTGQAQ